jgi:hypothetical protein
MIATKSQQSFAVKKSEESLNQVEAGKVQPYFCSKRTFDDEAGSPIAAVLAMPRSQPPAEVAGDAGFEAEQCVPLGRDAASCRWTLSLHRRQTKRRRLLAPFWKLCFICLFLMNRRVQHHQ